MVDCVTDWVSIVGPLYLRYSSTSHRQTVHLTPKFCPLDFYPESYYGDNKVPKLGNVEYGSFMISLMYSTSVLNDNRNHGPMTKFLRDDEVHNWTINVLVPYHHP